MRETSAQLVRRLSATETDDCIEWPRGRLADGYGMAKWNGKDRPTHRIALLLADGLAEFPNLLCLHSCDNPPCINPRHLRWGTNQDNTDDKLERDRLPDFKGESNGRSKLTADTVREMRDRYANETPRPTHKGLAADYAVSYQLVHLVLTRKAWGHVA